MSPRILCVAEKPAIARSVAQHLSGGSMQTVSMVMWKPVLIYMLNCRSFQFAEMCMSRIMYSNSILAALGVPVQSQ